MKKIYPGLASRLEFIVEDTDGLPVPSMSHSDTSSAGYRNITDGVRSSTTSVSLTSSVAATAAVSAGQFVTINSDRGHYAIDVPSGAAGAALDYVEAVVVFTAGHTVTAVQHEIDVTLQTTEAILVDTGSTIPAQITALNNLSAAQVLAALGSGTWMTGVPWNTAWEAEVRDALGLDAADLSEKIDEIVPAVEQAATDITNSMTINAGEAWA